MATISIALVKDKTQPNENPFKMNLVNARNLVNESPDRYEIVNENYTPPTAVTLVQKKKDAAVEVEVLQGENQGMKIKVHPDGSKEVTPAPAPARKPGKPKLNKTK